MAEEVNRPKPQPINQLAPLWRDGAREFFEKSPDENIVWRYEVKRSEIHLDKLSRKIGDLQAQIESTPALIEYPEGVSEEVEAVIDEHNTMLPDIEEIEAKLAHLLRIKAKLPDAAEPISVPR